MLPNWKSHQISQSAQLPDEDFCMTTQQLHLFNAMYVVAFVIAAVLTRATWRRIMGAMTGAAVAGILAIGVIFQGENVGWWHMEISRKPYFLALLWIDFALSGFVFLFTWRIARRFGGRGLAITMLVAVVLGPVRDYRYFERYPEWGAYAPGMAPILAVSATYLLLGIVGHGIMRIVAGPAAEDRLARRPWESRSPDSLTDTN